MNTWYTYKRNESPTPPSRRPRRKRRGSSRRRRVRSDFVAPRRFRASPRAAASPASTPAARWSPPPPARARRRPPAAPARASAPSAAERAIRSANRRQARNGEGASVASEKPVHAVSFFVRPHVVPPGVQPHVRAVPHSLLARRAGRARQVAHQRVVPLRIQRARAEPRRLVAPERQPRVVPPRPSGRRGCSAAASSTAPTPRRAPSP